MMIDIENEVYTAVAVPLKNEYPGITVDSVTTFSPSSFPFVSIEMTDCYPVRSTQNTQSNENHSVVAFEVNVYSNKQSGKKSQCKQILSSVDAILTDMGFSRTACTPIALDDASKFRYFARYSAVVGADKTIYRR